MVEDEYYVAEDLGALIRQLGAHVLGPVATLERARQLVESEGAIDAVLLDLNLRGHMAYELADQLRARAVPFAFVTGYDRSMLPPRFAHTPTIDKPVSERKLDALLDALLPTDAMAR